MSNLAKMLSCINAHLDEPDLPPVLPSPSQGHKSNRGLFKRVAGRYILSRLASQENGFIL